MQAWWWRSGKKKTLLELRPVRGASPYNTKRKKTPSHTPTTESLCTWPAPPRRPLRCVGGGHRTINISRLRNASEREGKSPNQAFPTWNASRRCCQIGGPFFRACVRASRRGKTAARWPLFFSPIPYEFFSLSLSFLARGFFLSPLLLLLLRVTIFVNCKSRVFFFF